MTDNRNFDPRQLRNTLGRFFTGVTVVTTLDQAGKPLGVTANSFSSVSLDPPLVLWSQAITSSSHPAFRDGERFTINILAADQIGVSQHFAKSGPDKFDDASYSLGLGGVPVIDGCCAVLECRKFATHPGGDHSIYIGEVERIRVDDDLKPLIFGDGKYMGAQPMELAKSA